MSEGTKDPNIAAMTVRVMASLTPRERRLLRARFGDLDRIDLEELKRRYEQTRARIEEIEERALRRLRRPLP